MLTYCCLFLGYSGQKGGKLNFSCKLCVGEIQGLRSGQLWKSFGLLDKITILLIVLRYPLFQFCHPESHHIPLLSCLFSEVLDSKRLMLKMCKV